MRLWEVYCADTRQAYPFLFYATLALSSPVASAVRSIDLVSYFMVQDVVEITNEHFLRPQVQLQGKAGAVARRVQPHAVDGHERPRLRILRWPVCSQVAVSHVHVCL